MQQMHAISQWQKAVEAAREWSGRGKLKCLGTIGRWVRKQDCGDFDQRFAHTSHAARKEALEAICEEGRAMAMEVATAAKGQGWDEDEVTEAMRAAMGPEGGGTAGVQKKLFEILNGARGRGAGGGAKLVSIYEWDDKNGREIRGAKAVLEHAQQMGTKINADTAVAMDVVRAIMDLARRGDGGRGRDACDRGRSHRARSEDSNWVEEVCTWEKFQEGLGRTEPQKGVGCDGWNAYLLRKAPEALQRRYWRAAQEALRTHTFPKEWKNKVAMLFMKPNEDPSELGGGVTYGWSAMA